MPEIVAYQIKLHYEIRGSGPKILFINGIGAGLDHPIGLFHSPLAAHFTILAYDARGLGASEIPKVGYTMADLAHDAAALAKAVGWKQYHVFGASMGGMVAQELAIRYPDAIEKLVLAATHAGGDNGAPAVVDQMWDMSPLALLQLSDTRQDEVWAAAHREAVEQMNNAKAQMNAAFAANPDFARGYQYQANAVMKHDTNGRLEKIENETLTFNGRFDGSIPLSAARDMAKQIPNCHFEAIDHGHGSWFFDNDTWEMVVSFLKN